MKKVPQLWALEHTGYAAKIKVFCSGCVRASHSFDLPKDAWLHAGCCVTVVNGYFCVVSHQQQRVCCRRRILLALHVGAPVLRHQSNRASNDIRWFFNTAREKEREHKQTHIRVPRVKMHVWLRFHFDNQIRTTFPIKIRKKTSRSEV